MLEAHLPTLTATIIVHTTPPSCTPPEALPAVLSYLLLTPPATQGHSALTKHRPAPIQHRTTHSKLALALARPPALRRHLPASSAVAARQDLHGHLPQRGLHVTSPHHPEVTRLKRVAAQHLPRAGVGAEQHPGSRACMGRTGRVGRSARGGGGGTGWGMRTLGLSCCLVQCVVLQCVVLQCVVLQCVVLQCVVLQCVVLQCVVLQ